MKNTMARIEAVKDLIQEAVDKGATSVEQIHRMIAALPLTVLEKRGLLAEEGREAGNLVDTSIGAVYDVIRRINHEVGDLASGIIEALENHADAQENLGTKKDLSGKE